MTVDELYGDLNIAARTQRRVGRRTSAWCVAVVEPDGSRTASSTIPLDAEMEIGSLSKCFTGLLYADALERGSVRASTKLRELLPLEGCPAGDVELEALARHRSGLPSVPDLGAEAARRTWRWWVHGANPYGDSVEQLMIQARVTSVGRPRHRYSNLGYELLGHALAAADSTSYAELLSRRLTGPLGLSSTYVATEPGLLGPAAVAGTSRRGRAQDAWTGEALGPAGGIRSTAGDMAVITRALLLGDCPGIAALDPTEPFSGPAVRIGAAWLVLARGARDLTWHNGRTGGFASWWGLDRDRATGVVLLSARSSSVDGAGLGLLDEVLAAA